MSFKNNISLGELLDGYIYKISKNDFSLKVTHLAWNALMRGTLF